MQERKKRIEDANRWLVYMRQSFVQYHLWPEDLYRVRFVSWFNQNLTIKQIFKLHKSKKTLCTTQLMFLQITMKSFFFLNDTCIHTLKYSRAKTVWVGQNTLHRYIFIYNVQFLWMQKCKHGMATKHDNCCHGNNEMHHTAL